MAENQDGQEKTEDATSKKLSDSRDRGQVSKSMDVTTAGVLLFGGLIVFTLGKPLIVNFQEFMKETLRNSATTSLTELSFPSMFNHFIIVLASMLLPILFFVGVIAALGDISQVGFHFASKKFTEGLDFKKVFNPISGLKKVFISKQSLFELTKNLLKVFILGIVVWSVLYNKDIVILSLVEKPFFEVGNLMSSIALELFLKVSVVYIAIAVADYYYQKWQYKENMKMTKKEVKEESKQSEGDPQIKGRIRSMMRSQLRKIMMSKVPEADVVITNPTHFAVALRYKSGENSAPVVVAKGLDFLAQKIKQIAYENDIPIVENPPLARQIYKLVEVEQEIPEELFKAVAEILAYIYSLKNNN